MTTVSGRMVEEFEFGCVRFVINKRHNINREIIFIVMIHLLNLLYVFNY